MRKMMYNEKNYLQEDTAMNEVWNLRVIYAGFEDPQYESDLNKLKECVGDYAAATAKLAQGDPLENLKNCITLEEEITRLGNKLVEYAMLRQSADARDAQAGSQIGRVMAVASSMAAPEAAFKDWASKLPNLMELVASDEILKEYTFRFQNLSKSSKYLLSGQAEAVMAKMQLSGGSAWSDLHGYITSTVPVSYRGKTINLSAVRNLAYDPDPQVRKDAYEAEIACYDRIKDSAAFALNSIKLETLSDCELRGYASPLARTLEHSNLEAATLDAMLGAMDEYLPKFWQYLKAKGKALGHENGLPWYDLFAPMGNASTKFTTQEARDFLVAQFEGFCAEEAQMIADAFDNEWIDFFPREGKAGGAFCAGVEYLGQSRILTNFDGAFGDVVTLAHELGHAWHNESNKDHRVLNPDCSMPLAETASTFNECVVMASAIAKAADDNEKLALIESQLQDATQIICDIYSRFRFEKSVFEKRPEEFMHADTLCQLMTDAQKASYGDGLDEATLHPYMWVCKGHYYGPTFYNFPYAFGGLFARGLYAQYEKEGAAFIPKYIRLLHTTPVASAEEVAKVADIDLTDKAFWRAALQTIADQIDLFCELVK